MQRSLHAVSLSPSQLGAKKATDAATVVASLPDWVRRQAPAEQRPPRPLAPSASTSMRRSAEQFVPVRVEVSRQALVPGGIEVFVSRIVVTGAAAPVERLGDVEQSQPAR